MAHLSLFKSKCRDLICPRPHGGRMQCVYIAYRHRSVEDRLNHGAWSWIACVRVRVGIWVFIYPATSRVGGRVNTTPDSKKVGTPSTFPQLKHLTCFLYSIVKNIRGLWDSQSIAFCRYRRFIQRPNLFFFGIRVVHSTVQHCRYYSLSFKYIWWPVLALSYLAVTRLTDSYLSVFHVKGVPLVFLHRH